MGVIKSIGLGIKTSSSLDGVMTIDTALDYAYGRRIAVCFSVEKVLVS